MELPKIGEIVYRQVTVDGKKVSKRLKLGGVTKFDERGNRIYGKFFGRDDEIVEKWMEYDGHDKMISEKDSDGNATTWERKYDDRGDCIYWKKSSGEECWIEYDDFGNQIHWKKYGGEEAWMEYDELGNEIFWKNSDGKLVWMEYDERGNQIHWKKSDGEETWMEYDDRDNEIHSKDSDGKEEWREWDDRNNCIHYKDSDGREYWFEIEYDENDQRRIMLHYEES